MLQDTRREQGLKLNTPSCLVAEQLKLAVIRIAETIP